MRLSYGAVNCANPMLSKAKMPPNYMRRGCVCVSVDQFVSCVFDSEPETHGIHADPESRRKTAGTLRCDSSYASTSTSTFSLRPQPALEAHSIFLGQDRCAPRFGFESSRDDRQHKMGGLRVPAGLGMVRSPCMKTKSFAVTKLPPKTQLVLRPRKAGCKKLPIGRHIS